MDFFAFRFIAHGLLLVFYLCPFWSVTDCQSTVATSTSVATPLTTSLKPPDVKNVNITGETTNSVTIQFYKVNDINNYRVVYFQNGSKLNEDIAWSQPNPVVRPLYKLTAAQKYNMTLYTVLGSKLSDGYQFTATTAPENVENFTAFDEKESSIALKWTKIPGISSYILKFNNNETNVPVESSGNYVVTNLLSSTEYRFSLYSVFEKIRSTGANLTTATAPSKAKDFKAVGANETSITLQWMKEAEINYILKFNGTDIDITAHPGQYTVTGLNHTTRYTFSLLTAFNNISGAEVSINTATAPPNTKRFGPVSQNETSITLQWEPVLDVTQYILKCGNINLTIQGTNKTTVSNLKSGTLFNCTLFSVFESVQSSGVHISAATAPRDAKDFQTMTPTETSIVLEWEKVDDIQEYELKYGKQVEHVNASSEHLVTHEVTNLESGTLYNFTLFTKFASVPSRGISREVPTVPRQVSSVKVMDRNLTTITLRWNSVKKDWKYIVDFDGLVIDIHSPDGDFVSYTAKSLKPGTVYTFSVTTQFKMLNSTSYENTTVTVIDCSIVNWQVTETSIQGAVEGAFTNATATNGSQTHYNSGSGKDVQFTDLYPGANYSMKLLYNDLEQCNQPFTIKPPVLEAKCKNWDAGYSIYIEWNRPRGIWDSVEINVANKMHQVVYGELYAIISNVQPAKKYNVSITSISGSQRSKTYSFPCPTDARGVIAGAFFGVLLFLVLACVVVFIMLRRPDFISKQNQPSVKKNKWIPLDKFPGHFTKLSADENKGFSLEYEDLGIVGTTQSQKAATMEENKPKNRFVNVLPYDHSRVKLISSPQNDYINANYMSGYNSSREFIAAQGPLQSTVNDFWRMIWEQKVRGIVMVTNCTEGGRNKCEQYWPDRNSGKYGDLEIFPTSEQKETDWTLREFKVKHRRTLEERTVRHFHFTAWPDHGVPEGTQVLIQFRALVRRHMQTEAAGTPTVVHCSAGVGRTGTIIALDVLLQQMEKEKAVDIYGFVYKMRLNRPLMVQTESQYVFLHQCILDILLLNGKHEENIYENELIYANATALREFQNNINND